MPGYLDVIKKEYAPKIESLADDIKARQDKTFFWPTGTQVYCGIQGSGKTISAVKHLHQLKDRYPGAILLSNLLLTGYAPRYFRSESDLKLALERLDPETEYVCFRNIQELALALVAANNGKRGVIYLIDEIHTYFNALDSKNIPMYVFTEISQQRKQRKLIIGTSQLFLRMAKPLREQCDNLIMCKTYLGVITSQKAYEGATLDEDNKGKIIGTMRKSGWFFHTRAIRSLYDTFQKVVSGSDQYALETTTKIDLGKNKKALMVK